MKTSKTWPVLKAETQNAVKAALLDLFKNETNRKIRHKVSDVIGMLAGHVVSEGGLLPSLLPCLTLPLPAP
jgi:hypothetical protein